MYSANTWKQILLTNPFEEAGNKNLKRFAKATLVSTAKEDRICALVEDKDTPILAVAPVTKLIKLYFGLSNLGVTRFVTDDKIVGFDGLSSIATPVVFELGNLETTVTVPHPTNTILKAAKTKEDLETAALGARSSFENSPYVLLPPFLTKILVQSDSRDPSVLYFEILAVINSFDDSHKDDADYEKALDSCFNVLVFLWAVLK